MTQYGGAEDLPWIEGLVETYAPWTATANGAGLDERTDHDLNMGRWNDVYCDLLARVAARIGPDRAAAHVARLVAVPDEPFFDLAAALVRALDVAHFGGGDLSPRLAVSLRSLVADRLMKGTGWSREQRRTELSVGTWIGPAIAALFFSDHGPVGGARCYVLPPGVERLDPFLPILSKLIEDGPAPLTALLTLNLLDIAPRSGHLPFLLTSALTWLRRQPDNVSQSWLGLSEQVPGFC